MRKLLLGALLAVAFSAIGAVSGLVVHDHSEQLAGRRDAAGDDDRPRTFESSEQAISTGGDTVTIAHGLGAVPRLVEAVASLQNGGAGLQRRGRNLKLRLHEPRLLGGCD